MYITLIAMYLTRLMIYMLYLNAEQVAQRATDALNEKPFAMIRLGDGEARVLAWPDGISKTTLDRRMRYWFGRIYTPAEIEAMQRDLLDAIREADVVGMGKLDGDNIKWRRRLWDMVDVGIWCDCDVHRHLWERNLLAPIIEQAGEVTLLTCRDVQEDFAKLFDVTPEVVVIPREARDNFESDHYPGRFHEVCEILQDTEGLWLVGAGLLGKTYCVRARRAGAVALDLGSVFDGWGGKYQTRSYLDKRYKL